MSTLLIVLPSTRASCGRLALIGGDGKTLFGPVRALGTANPRVANANANPARDPLLPFGHTPSGELAVVGSLPPGFLHPRRPRRFGRSGALVLAPRSGPAMDAVKNGRQFYYVHGGPPDRQGRLRPTYGGVRVEESAIAALLVAVNRAFLDGDGVRSVRIVDAPRPESVRPVDRVGARRPQLGTRANAAPASGPLSRPLSRPLGMRHAAFLTMGAGLLGRGPGDPSTVPSRRRFLASVALLLAAVDEAGCSGNEAPSSCSPLSCDPIDTWCPPDGYVCGDVSGAGGDFVVLGPDPWDLSGPPVSGDNPPADTSGGSG